MAKPATEKDLARVVVAWLRSCGHDKIYQEVQCSGGVADIVVDCGGVSWVIETKQTLGLSVLAQANVRIRNCVAHRVSAACWHSNSRERWFAEKVARDHGIGVLTAHKGGSVREDVPPALHRIRRHPRLKDILKSCRDEHLTFCEAGGNRGGYWTPFKATCEALREEIRKAPGICMKDAVARIKHHYGSNSTARSSLALWIREGKVPGVQMEKVGGRTRLTLVEVVDGQERGAN